MKNFYTYIVTYDIKGDENSDVRNRFRESLINTCSATMLSESTYAFSSTNGVPDIKSKITRLYKDAYKQNGKEWNGADKVWLVCADKKADPNSDQPYEMACYELVSEI